MSSIQLSDDPSGSLHSLYSHALPEQQALGEPTSVAGPTHVQTPPEHVPDAHSVLLLHAPPLPTYSWQRPSKQKFEAQPSFAAHGDPSPLFAVHVPVAQYADAQSLSLVHARPIACRPQVPSTQRFAEQSLFCTQTLPFGRGVSQAPPMQSSVGDCC